MNMCYIIWSINAIEPSKILRDLADVPQHVLQYRSTATGIWGCIPWIFDTKTNIHENVSKPIMIMIKPSGGLRDGRVDPPHR